MTAKRDRLYGSPTGDSPVGARRRPQAGPADEATRRAALRRALDTPTRSTGVAPARPEPKNALRGRPTAEQLRMRGDDIDAYVEKNSK